MVSTHQFKCQKSSSQILPTPFTSLLATTRLFTRIYIYIYSHQLTEKPTHSITNFIYRNQKIIMDWFFCSRSKKSSAPFTLILILLCCCSSPSLVFTFTKTASSLPSSSSAFNLTTISFDEGYSHLFGDGNLIRSPDGKNVRLLLNRFSGT